MTDTGLELPLFDVTARKVHQWSMVALVVLGFLLSAASPVAGAIPLAIAGIVMLVGRFWWPADIFRQLTWRLLEPAGLVNRRHVHEDHDTRRIARVIGGFLWLVSAALLLLGLSIVAWVVAFAIVVMVALDAAVDFCVLCFAVAQARR
jgi:predicted anti-sigma-YlaC factor YlaD